MKLGEPVAAPLPGLVNQPYTVPEELELNQIQSEVLRGYNRPTSRESPGERNLFDAAPKHGAYVLLRFDTSGSDGDSTDKARAIFADLMPRSALESQWSAESVRCNVGFTHAGIEVLLRGVVTPPGVAEKPFPRLDEVLDSVGTAFSELKRTMSGSAESLGDVGDSAPQHWDFADGVGRDDAFTRLHAVVMIFGGDRDLVDARAADVAKAAAGNGAKARVERCAELDNQREHFGYLDGISQPAIDGLEGPVTGHGTIDESGKWRAIKPGELVMGYRDEEGPFAGSPFLRNGSFFVLRKLEQDADDFHAFLGERAAQVGKSKDWVAARLMGRYFNGKPVLLDEPGTDDDPGHDHASDYNNDFRYADDNTGFKCPFGAHIRRANPRDVSGRIADRAERHRLVRRTLSYSERLDGSYLFDEHERKSRGQRLMSDAPPPPDPSIKRGMLFGCFNAAIGRQFEVVQGAWLNGGASSPARLFSLRDPISGANHGGTSDFVIPSRPVDVLQDVRRFTKTRGGAYFFVPSLQVYKALIGLPGDRDDVFRQVRVFLAELFKRLTPGATTFLSMLGAALDINAAEGRGTHAAVRSVLGTGERQEVKTEKQLVFVMAPFPSSKRAAIEMMLADTAKLDQAFGAVGIYPQGTTPTRSIHHARFTIVSSFSRFQGDRPEPDKFPLPHTEGYLFFGCWFDGEREALIEGLAAQLASLPFVHCHGCPQPEPARPEKVANAFAKFVELHALPVGFAYAAYLQGTHEIRKSLGLRDRFVALLADLQIARVKGDDGQALVDAFMSYVAGRSTEAANRSK